MFDRATSTRLTNIIFVSQSLQSASQIAIFTLLAIVSVRLSGNEGFAGLPSTTLTLSQAVAAFPVGILMGRFGRRIGLGLSYTSSAIGAVLGIIAITQGWFLMLIASAAMIGAGRAGADQSRFTAGELFPEDERARMIGRIVFAGTIGAILGPLLVNPGSAVAQALGWDGDTGPWLIAMAFYTAAALIIFVFLRPEPMQIASQLAIKAAADEDAPETTGRSTGELLRHPKVQLAILSTLISQVVMVTLMVITPLHMAHNDHGKDAVSIVIMAHTLGMFGFSSMTGNLIDRFGRVRMMVAGAVTMIIAALISPLSTELPILIIGLFLLGLGWNFGYIAGSSLLADALKGSERTRMQGTNDMLVSAAAALGNFSSGPIFSAGGYLAVTSTGLVITLLFLWMVYLLSPHAAEVRTV